MIELETGARFSSWTVLSFAGFVANYRPMYLCRCNCGTEREVFSRSLRQGRSKSCGCAARQVWAEITRKAKLRHGNTVDRGATPEYTAWLAIKARCYNENEKCYTRYGGRGIRVCDRWLGSFENFLADMGPRPTPDHSIDRKDVNGNYDPDNCQWETQTRQQRNRRNSMVITAFGLNLQINDFCEAVDGDRQLIRNRIIRGWPQEDAILTPRRNNGGRYSNDIPVNAEKLVAMAGEACQRFKMARAA